MRLPGDGRLAFVRRTLARLTVSGAIALPGVCQLSGPPAGVPVPRAPVASDGPDTGSGEAGAPNSRVFRVHAVDGRNGGASVNAHLRLWYDDATGSGYTLATDKRGIAIMPEPAGMPVRVLIAPLDRIDCRKRTESGPPSGYNMEEIAAKGAVTENNCGSVSARAQPGELIIFVRPPRWYEGISRDTP